MILHMQDNFDPEKIADSGQCFRAARLPDGSFRFIVRDRVLRLCTKAPGTISVSCPEKEWNAFWASYFDFGRNYAAIREAVTQPYMQEAADFGAGLRILRQDPWETLVSFILSQRKSIPAIRGCIEALCRRCGKPINSEADSFYAFPMPNDLAALSDEDLRACSLGYRAPYVRDAAERSASGELDLKALETLNDEELLAALMRVKGVGIKVASCTALFAYGRTGIAPIDTWIRKVIDERFGGNDPFPAYGNNAGILQQYVFYHALKHKESFKSN